MTILAPDTLGERTANCHELLGLAEEVQDDVVRFDAAFIAAGRHSKPVTPKRPTTWSKLRRESPTRCASRACWRRCGSCRPPRRCFEARSTTREYFGERRPGAGAPGGCRPRGVLVQHRTGAGDPPLAGPARRARGSVDALRRGAGLGLRIRDHPLPLRGGADRGRAPGLPGGGGRRVPAGPPRHARRFHVVQPGVPRDAGRGRGDRGNTARSARARTGSRLRARRSPGRSASISSGCSKRRWGGSSAPSRRCARRSVCTTSSARRCSAPRARSSWPGCSSISAGTTRVRTCSKTCAQRLRRTARACCCGRQTGYGVTMVTVASELAVVVVDTVVVDAEVEAAVGLGGTRVVGADEEDPFLVDAADETAVIRVAERPLRIRSFHAVGPDGFVGVRGRPRPRR